MSVRHPDTRGDVADLPRLLSASFELLDTLLGVWTDEWAAGNVPTQQHQHCGCEPHRCWVAESGAHLLGPDNAAHCWACWVGTCRRTLLTAY